MQCIATVRNIRGTDVPEATVVLYVIKHIEVFWLHRPKSYPHVSFFFHVLTSYYLGHGDDSIVFGMVESDVNITDGLPCKGV